MTSVRISNGAEGVGVEPTGPGKESTVLKTDGLASCPIPPTKVSGPRCGFGVRIATKAAYQLLQRREIRS